MEKNPDNPPPPPPSSDPPPPSTAAAAAKSESSNHPIHSALKSLNKSSFKISKPSRPSAVPVPSLPPPSTLPSSSDSSVAALPPAPPQPPVYNIDKNNFREIVQKLTGSPAPPPAPIPAPVPPRPAAPVPPPPQPSSTPRLHRIRPPPLANLSTRPPQIGSQTVLSPLPPLPTVGITAESPVSAYLRRLQGGAVADLVLPPSPLGFGCIPAVPSPRTASYMMMMSSVGMPTSPGVPPMPAPSPREGR